MAMPYNLTRSVTRNGLTRDLVSTTGGRIRSVGSSLLSGWTTGVTHTIGGSPDGELSNYVIRLRIDYGSGTDGGWEHFTGGGCKTDFSDVRFTASDGLTELSYALVEKTDSDYAIFDVKIPTIGSGSGYTLIVQYGNASASSTSDPSSVYLLYDDMSSLTGWTNYGSTLQVQAAGGPGGEDVIEYVNAAADGGVYKAFTTENWIGEIQLYKESGVTGGYGGFFGNMVDTNNWSRSGTESVNAATALGKSQIRVNTGGSKVNYYETCEDLDDDTWYKRVDSFRVARSLSFDAVTDFQFTANSPQGCVGDGTSIWTTEHTTSRIARYNYAGSVQDSSTSLPSPAAGGYGGLAIKGDYVYALLLNQGSPSATHVVRFNKNDLSESEYVANISSTFTANKGGNGIVAYGDSWLVSTTKGPDSEDYRQYIYVFNSDFSELKTSFLTGQYEGYGYQGLSIYGDTLYATTHLMELHTWHIHGNPNTGVLDFTFVDKFDLSTIISGSGQTVAWDGTSFLVVANLETGGTGGGGDVRSATFSAVSGSRTHVSRVANPGSMGSVGLPGRTYTSLGSQAYIGVGAFRNTRFFDMRVRPYTTHTPPHGSWAA